MAQAGGVRLAARSAAPVWSRRVIEWALFGVLLVVLVIVFIQHARQLQARAELAAFKTTLGTLRSTMVVDHLQRQARNPGQAVAPEQRNPFQLLQRLPVNYAGENVQPDGAPRAPGSWVYDRNCVCIGYTPLFPQVFESASGDSALWFRIVGVAGPPGLAAKEAYVWLDESIQ